MKSKTTFFSLSKGMIKEDIKRFWPFALILFILMFFSSTFLLIIFSGNVSTQANILTSFVVCNNWGMLAISLIFPIIISILLFKYLFSVDSVSLMHSMPVSRTQLYFSKYLTGLMMMLIPLILVSCTLVPLMDIIEKKYSSANLNEGTTFISFLGDIDAGTYSLDLLVKGVLMYGLMMVFVFTLSVLASMVSGNNLMAVINSLLFNFMGSAMYWVLTIYFTMTLYGYDFSQNQYISARIFSPIFAIFTFGDNLMAYQVVVYICVIIIVFILSAWLYKKRKLEKAGSPIVFRAMEVLTLYIITFIVMFITGFILNTFGESISSLYAGIITGGIVTLIATSMIINKTFRIFKRKNLIDMSIFVAVASIFICTVNFDLLGFETRTPEIDSIKTAEVKGFEFALPLDQDNIYFDSMIGVKVPVIKDPEALGYLTAYHKDIGESEEGKVKDKNLTYFSDEFHYEKKGMFNLSRRYEVSYDFMRNNENLKKLLESDPYKNSAAVAGLNDLKITSIDGRKYLSDESVDDIVSSLNGGEYFNPRYSDVTYSKHIKSEYYDELVNALQKDYKDATFEEMITTQRPAAVLDIRYQVDRVDEYGEYWDENITFNVPFTYKRTLDLLKKNGYYEDVALQYDSLYKVEAYILNRNKHSGDKVTITDNTLRKNIFNNTEDDIKYPREYIIVKFTYPLNMMKNLDEYEYMKDQGKKTVKMYYCINKDNPVYDQIVQQYEKYGQS